MARILLNNCTTRLTAALGTSDTTAYIPAADVSKFTAKGALSATNYVNGTLVKMSGFREVAWEIVKFTGTGTGSLTMVRAQEGTTALSLSIGDVVSVRTTATAIEETGTFTPSLNFFTTPATTLTLSTATGRYTKRGAHVHVEGYMVVSAYTAGPASGPLRVGNLPYTVAGRGGSYPRATGSAISTNFSGAWPTAVWAEPASSWALFYAAQATADAVAIGPGNLTATSVIGFSLDYYTDQ